MDRRQVLLGMTAVGLAGPFNLGQLLSAQSSEANSPVSRCNHERLTSLDFAGLRGPVKTCVVHSGDTTEYGLDGELLSLTYHSEEHVQYYERDSLGRLVKHNGTVFSYDSEGRLLTWTETGFYRLEYHYKADGSMVSVQTFEHPHLIGGGKSSPHYNWHHVVAFGMGVPMGGNVTTIYPRNSATSYPRTSPTSLFSCITRPPAEVQIRSADGQIVMRTVITYYDRGRVTVVRERDTFRDATTSTLRNEQGDEIRKRTTVKYLDPSSSRWHRSEDGDILYDYQYDSYGNWTKRTWTVANGSSVWTRSARRVLTYY
jgi:hypothetical protein